MKKLFSVFLSLSAALLFFSCDKADSPESANESAQFSISFTFDKEAFSTLTKSNATVFNEFYEKMNTGELVAAAYDLTFTEVNTGVVYQIQGKWNEDKMVTVRTGTYQITGTSTAEGDFIQEKCSIVINEQLDIAASTTVIVLHPTYDCSLLVFTHPEITELTNTVNGTATNFFVFSTYHYAFVRTSMSGGDTGAYIAGRYSDNTTFRVLTNGFTFENGYYYIHNATVNTFTLPAMQDGMGNSGTTGGATAGTSVPYVDLGLSVKWATYNVGASSEEEIGVRYAWGETEGKSYYDWDNYKWCNGTYTALTKYCTNSTYGTVDGKNKLELADDIAFVTYGDGWRMPTKEELQELANCTWTTETVNGVDGARVTGPNNNSIFLPGNGQWDEGGLHLTGCPHIWSSDADDTYFAYKLEYNTSSVVTGYNSHRHDGLCVRGVYTK